MTFNQATADTVGVIVLLLILTMAVALVARSLRLPYTLALVLAGLVIGLSPLFPNLHLDPNLVLFLFLPALLFEGAWTVDTKLLRRDGLLVFAFAVPGVFISLLVIAAVAHFGAALAWLPALLVGAVISPTDPLAVISLLRQLGLPDRLLTILEGESLFNDGVGAAAFEVILAALLTSLHMHSEFTGLSTFLITLKVLWLLGGGVLLGAVVGYVVSRLVRVVNDPLLETTVTFSVAYGVYILGVLAGTSGLLAVVAAGLLLGGYGKRTGMSERTIELVDSVWEFTGYLANSFLFLLLGVTLGSTSIGSALPAILWAVVGLLAGRALMIYALVPLYNWLANHRSRLVTVKPVPRAWRPLMLLSGLRGALSLALVLSIPKLIPGQDQLKLVVYGVVLITLLGQGLGLRLFLPRQPFPRARPAGS